MEKVVSRGIKIDLHIHSEYSKAKDGKKVEENTLDNIPVLVQGLLANQVEMCAITDHDAFNYGMYYELKKEDHLRDRIQVRLTQERKWSAHRPDPACPQFDLF